MELSGAPVTLRSGGKGGGGCRIFFYHFWAKAQYVINSSVDTVFLLKIRQTKIGLGKFCDEFQGLKYEILWRGIIIGRN